MELRGKFYSSDPSELSIADRHLICQCLGFYLENDILFENTARACGELIIGRGPDITTGSGRKFWVYGPDEQLPA
jgi:hypothetical protein